jgi:hypothetical protein
MKTFVIDASNCAQAYASSKTARKGSGGARFATEKDLASVSADWPMLRLVAIWNKLPGVEPVRKFTSRVIALRRIWKAMQVLAPRARSKTELVIGLLKQTSGATLAQIMAATGWQAHSVRGFVCTRPKRLGFQIESFKRQGERVYRIR